MKKFLFLLVILLQFFNVNAKEPNINQVDYIFAARIKGEKSKISRFGFIYMDDNYAFTTNPYEEVGNSYEENSDIKKELYNDWQKNRIDLIIHYGINTHKNNIYYYMATQELIWEFYDGMYVFIDGAGKVIDLDKYKEEIISKVNRHSFMPTFANRVFYAKANEKLILTDDNNVIDDFNIETDIDYIKENNSLIINVPSSSTTIKLTQENKSGKNSYGYTGNGSPLITSSLNEKIEYTVNIVPNGISQYFNIKFYENLNKVKEKFKFQIFDLNNSNYIKNGEIFETDEFGNYYSDFELVDGTYKIVYIDIPKGYVPLDSNIFSVDSNDSISYEIKSYVSIPNGELNINRYINIFDKCKVLDNIEYNVYASENIYKPSGELLFDKNQLVYNGITKNGVLNINLPLGSYNVKEVNNLYSPEEDKVYNVKFEYEDATISTYKKRLDIITELPKISVNIKTYVEEELFGNFDYELYAAEDIYIGNELVYNKNQFIRTFSVTNGNLNSYIEIPYGKYMLKELNLSNKYLSNNNMKLDLNNNNINLIFNYKYKRGSLLVKTNCNECESIIFNNSKYLFENNEILIDNIIIGNYDLYSIKKYNIDINYDEITSLNIECNKEDDNDNIINNDNDSSNDNSSNSDSSNNDSSNNDSSNNDSSDEIIDSDELLPDTSNYIDKYCYIYKMFLIAGIIFKIYVKSNK